MLRPPELSDLEERRLDVLRQVKHDRLGARAARMRGQAGGSAALARLWRKVIASTQALQGHSGAQPAMAARPQLNNSNR